MTITTNDQRTLTPEEAETGNKLYRELVDAYEAEQKASGAERQISEIYIYEGFWIRAYGAKYITFPPKSGLSNHC